MAPKNAAANTTNSSAPGMNIILRKEANDACDDIYPRIPSATPIIAELPAASPSSPSVRFAPFDTDAIINATAKTNTRQVRGSCIGPAQRTRLL